MYPLPSAAIITRPDSHTRFLISRRLLLIANHYTPVPYGATGGGESTAGGSGSRAGATGIETAYGGVRYDCSGDVYRLGVGIEAADGARCVLMVVDVKSCVFVGNTLGAEATEMLRCGAACMGGRPVAAGMFGGMCEP